MFGSLWQGFAVCLGNVENRGAFEASNSAGSFRSQFHAFALAARLLGCPLSDDRRGDADTSLALFDEPAYFAPSVEASHTRSVGTLFSNPNLITP